MAKWNLWTADVSPTEAQKGGKRNPIHSPEFVGANTGVQTISENGLASGGCQRHPKPTAREGTTWRRLRRSSGAMGTTRSLSLMYVASRSAASDFGRGQGHRGGGSGGDGPEALHQAPCKKFSVDEGWLSAVFPFGNLGPLPVRKKILDNRLS